VNTVLKPWFEQARSTARKGGLVEISSDTFSLNTDLASWKLIKDAKDEEITLAAVPYTKQKKNYEYCESQLR